MDDKMQLNNSASSGSSSSTPGSGTSTPASLICRPPQGAFTPVKVSLTHVVLSPLGPVGGEPAEDCGKLSRKLPIWTLPILQLNPRCLKEMIEEMKLRRLDAAYIYMLEETQALVNQLIACTDIKLGRGLPRFLDTVLHQYREKVKSILTSLQLLGVDTLSMNLTHVRLPGCTPESTLFECYTEDAGSAVVIPNGGNFAKDLQGERLCGTFLVTDSYGKPIPFVRVTITLPYPQALVHPRGPKLKNPALRKCVIEADENGRFCLQAVRPQEHTLSPKGDVGLIRDNLAYDYEECPGTLLFKFHKGSEELLTTALFIEDEKAKADDSEPPENKALWVRLQNLTRGTAEDCGVQHQKRWWEISYQFSIGTRVDFDRYVTQERVNYLADLATPILDKDAVQMLNKSAPLPDDFY